MSANETREIHNLAIVVGADTRVHRAGCADVNRKRNNGAFTIEAATIKDVVLALYPPSDYADEVGEDGENWRRVSGDFDFLPCCPQLPVE